MNTFARTRSMHQYYRDIFTHAINLPEADVLPARVVAEVLNYGNSDYQTCEAQILAAVTELPPEQERALKKLICAIAMANSVLDSNAQGQKITLTGEQITTITNNLVAVLQNSNNKNYLIAAIQVLFRINEINSAIFLISNNLSELADSALILKILLLTCLMEEDYNQAHVVIQQLTENADLIGEDSLTLIMVVCAIYKLGGHPDSFIDFRPLLNDNYKADRSKYHWHVEPSNNGKSTVFVACDKAYYYEHAIALLLSVYETNQDDLNVHFHVYNCDREIEEHIRLISEKLPGIAVSLSSEVLMPIKGINVHYACRRFIFLFSEAEKFSGPIIALDADCLVRKSWREFHSRYSDKPLIVTWQEGLPLWEQVPAGFIYINPGELANKYFSSVACFIDENLQANNAQWYLDQIALSFSLEKLSPIEQLRVGRESISSIVDVYHSEEAFSWVVTTQKQGKGKYYQYKSALMERYLPDNK
ncbi:hypothetical protein RI049_09010 [Cedecea neteri]|uniref:hypothetical protein n=1 Tax=Cedecea neteri TaxID=158822 RepID=UPI002AA6FF4F|nr:hypothetical protein [Cedecea neteri]WPU24861.1 hypothetical protein RI049_09010 [Cedecea neteri]